MSRVPKLSIFVYSGNTKVSSTNAECSQRKSFGSSMKHLPGVEMPPPSALKRKILLKNKRLKPDVEKTELELFHKGELQVKTTFEAIQLDMDGEKTELLKGELQEKTTSETIILDMNKMGWYRAPALKPGSLDHSLLQHLTNQSPPFDTLSRVTTSNEPGFI